MRGHEFPRCTARHSDSTAKKSSPGAPARLFSFHPLPRFLSVFFREVKR